MNALRHVVIDVEAILDPNVPPKEGANEEDERIPPPAQWQIVTIGCFNFANYEPEQFGCITAPTEAELVRLYASYLEKERPCVVTWNGRYFDNPVIGLRALKYLIPMPWWYGSNRGPRYRYGDKALDVKDALADFGAARTASQSQVARLLGWPGKGELTGADVARLHAEGRAGEIEAYCLSDVAQLAAIWLRYEVLRGNIAASRWPTIARKLLGFLAKKPVVGDVLAQVDRALYIGDAQLPLIT